MVDCCTVSVEHFRLPSSLLTATLKTVYLTPSKFTFIIYELLLIVAIAIMQLLNLHKISNDSDITDEAKRLKVITELVPTLDFGEVEQHVRQNKMWKTFSTVLHQMGRLGCLWVFVLNSN